MDVDQCLCTKHVERTGGYTNHTNAPLNMATVTGQHIRVEAEARIESGSARRGSTGYDPARCAVGRPAVTKRRPFTKQTNPPSPKPFLFSINSFIYIRIYVRNIPLNNAICYLSEQDMTG